MRSRLKGFSHDLDGTGTSNDVRYGQVAGVGTAFGYNPASQLTSLTRSNDSYAWSGHYNVNRAYGTNGLNQLTSAGATALGYDGRGNLTSSGSSTYTYTSENRLATGPGGVTILYDPTGRISKLTQGASVTTFEHLGPRLIIERNAAGTILKRYVHGPKDDEPIVWYEGAALTNKRWLHTDERGSVIAVSNSAGTSIALNKYDEYGIPLSTNLGRFGYTGQAYIPELGLWYYKARMYSATLGRFMQTDPIGYKDGINWYDYVDGDPVNRSDPTGQWGVLGKVVKLAIKGGDVAATLAGAVQDVKVLTSAKATLGQRVAAGISLASEVVSPVSIRDGKAMVKAVKGTCCFVAGTLVDTEAGLRPIETIKVGERVWARDEVTGETALKEVTNLIQRHERVIWEVKLTGLQGEAETFETTDDHPWWIVGQGWKRTEELKPIMAVVTRNGRGMLLTSVTETSRTASTYNLTVADFETYFVGKQRVLVHNCPTGSYTNTYASGKTYDGKGDSSRAAVSARRIEREHGDPAVSTETRSASNDRESFKQESQSLDRNGGPGSNQNYNQIESPGKRMRREDGEID